MTEPQAGEQPIRILLVDDHAVLRKGMRALLEREPGLEVAGEAEDGEQAVHAADRLRPDVILMDLEMKGMGGMEATRQITAARPETRVVVLTSHTAEEDVFPALKAGAIGYLLNIPLRWRCYKLSARHIAARRYSTRRLPGWFYNCCIVANRQWSTPTKGPSSITSVRSGVVPRCCLVSYVGPGI